MSDRRSYSELILLPTFKERCEYLKLNGKIGEELFGYTRYLNQVFYQSYSWRSVRRKVIIRDGGNDLGIEGRPIGGTIFVHHMNPLTLDEIRREAPCMVDAENLICVSRRTHDAITLGDESLLEQGIVIRTKNDTCPWKIAAEEVKA